MMMKTYWIRYRDSLGRWTRRPYIMFCVEQGS